MPVAPPSPLAIVSSLLFLALLGGIAAAWVWAFRRLRRGQPLLPQAPLIIVPWGPRTVVAVLLLRLGLEMVLVPQFMPQERPKGFQLSPFQQLLLVAEINAGLLLLVPPLLRITSGARLRDLGLTRADLGRNLLRGFVTCLLLLPVVYPIMFAVSLIWKPQGHPLAEMVRDDPSGRVALLAVVSGVFLAPATEELLFRAILQGWLTRLFHWPRGREPATARDIPTPPEVVPLSEPPPPADYAPTDGSVWVAPKAPLGTPEGAGSPLAGGPLDPRPSMIPNLLTSLLFAAVHFAQWPAPIPLFLLALGLGYLYQRTGSLVAPIAMHASFNGISTAALFLGVLLGGNPPAPGG
ncbi:MAG: CPBP family intramembrane metalloprotease [Isosphaeraceae bacterium]|nr:CPBP family intramembrane metalloprotease [Isosphaeraceae bacterium]